MLKPKETGPKQGFNVLLEGQQKIELEKIAKERQRSVGFLIREAVGQYLAGAKKKA